MRYMLGVTLMAAFAGAAFSQQQVKVVPDPKAVLDLQLDELLGVDAAALRADEFARSKAMAERYGDTARARLLRQIDRLHLYCKLSDAQRRRLELATLGSAKTTGKRLLAAVEATASIDEDNGAWKQLQNLRGEMQASLADPSAGSFWKKAVASTLTSVQLADLEKNLAARAAFEKKAWVYRVVDELDKEVLLLIGQREKLMEFLGRWIGANPIPTAQRGRRGAWKMLPEELVIEAVFPLLDDVHRDALVAIAPRQVRKKLFPESGEK